jgi:prepilin peptidase CpaA
MSISGSDLLYALALSVAGLALLTDVRYRRIPNWLTGSALLIGLIANLVIGGLQGGLMSLAGVGLGLAVLLPFYVLRTMGAGDVKLLAAFGALLGPQMLIGIAVYGSIVGGIQALIILRRLGRVSLTLHQMLVMRTLPSRSGAKAPYAVALSAGACLAILHPLVLTF